MISMTPGFRTWIDDLFVGKLRTNAARREAWLCPASAEDDNGLHDDVGHHLGRDKRRHQEKERFLTGPEKPARAVGQTESWPSAGGRRLLTGSGSSDQSATSSINGHSGFSPKAVIAAGIGSYPRSDAESLVRARLHGLPMIYILTVAMAIIWRCAVLRNDDHVLNVLDTAIVALFGGIIALLSGRRPISFDQLNALELVMIGMLALRIAVIEYRLVLMFSLRGDPMMAQLVVKNGVLLTAVFILTYGLYVPKSWRRATLVVGPLALLPFATLAVLRLAHPTAMHWLGQEWKPNGEPRFYLFAFDAMILAVVTAGSSFGAHAISRLRRQAAEARQLGQYHLRQKISAGGMGEIYLAEHQLLKRPCALKLIRAGGVANSQALARFEREVRLTAALSHPNTVDIYDYGRTEDGTYYYVMEYLPGLSLAELVEQFGPQPPGRAVYLLRQVCLALSEAHGAGLIHRDIKPSNIFASRRGGMDDVAKLLDFGLVLPMDRLGAPQLSGESQILGTPMFMSPEQALGERELDGRSDIYSLGAVAYHLLTGRPPFDDVDGIQLMIAIARDSVVPPSQVHSSIPRDLEGVVLRCLAKDAADRFPDAESVERALGACACSHDWNQHAAAQWWRDSGWEPATHDNRQLFRSLHHHGIDRESKATIVNPVSGCSQIPLACL